MNSSEGKRTMKSKALVALRVVIFLALAAALFVYLNMAVMLKGTAQTKGAVDSFYNLQNDTVDVMYIGTSATSRYFVNPVSYHDYGIACYSFGINASPTYLADDLMKEVLRTQKPDLFIVELRPSYKNPYSVTDASVYKTLDAINLLSPNRISMSQKALLYNDESEDVGLADYLFPIVKYHDRLIQGEMTEDDFLLKTPANKTQGYQLSSLTLSQEPQKAGRFTDEVGTMSDARTEVLDRLLDYCDSIDTEVLFVLSPFSASAKLSKSLNTSAAYVESRGYTVLNCNNEQICDDMGLDWETDFYNERHVNYLGAEKYTAYLSQYLKDHYELADRRGDERYAVWESGYERYEKYVAKGIKYHESGDEDEGEGIDEGEGEA